MRQQIFNMFWLKTLLTIGCFMAVSCSEDYVPKPKAHLRLEYPEPEYKEANLNLPFNFKINDLVGDIRTQEVSAATKSYGVNLEYPSMKATVFLTYKAVEKSNKNLMEFLRDAQNFTQKHTIKADEIPVTAYENKSRKVYGAFAEVKGNVASPAQFYVTDSVNHFLTGSLYFNARPNYDSILPAAHYLQNDIKQIMETLRWQD